MFFQHVKILLTVIVAILTIITASKAHEEVLLGEDEVKANHEQGVETIDVLLSGNVSFYDTIQIRRLLRPWVKPNNIRFEDHIDQHGRPNFFTTVVQIQVEPKASPRIYKIIQQLRDQRFRGANAASKTRVLKTEVTVSGEMPTYANWTRSSLRNVPYWRNWRGDTSSVNHVLVTAADQKFVFHRNKTFDSLRHKLGQVTEGSNIEVQKVVKMKAKVAGFDGSYPVMSVQKFQIDYINTRKGKRQSTKSKGLQEETKTETSLIEED